MSLKQVKGKRGVFCAGILAALIPFALVAYLIWALSAGTAWIIPAKAEFVFLCLQTGAVTVYFMLKGYYKAAVHMWLTLLSLGAISLTVPFLSAQTGNFLDGTDIDMEITAPLYFFMTCLAAAWLLPGKARGVMRVISMLLILLYIGIQLLYIGYFHITHALLSVNMMIAVAQTNMSEAAEYVKLNVSYLFLAISAALLVLFGWAAFRMNRLSFRGPHVSGGARMFLLLLFAANCVIAESTAEATHVVQVFSDTKTTLESFGEYEKILENRKHMAVGDPETLQKLRDSIPDGVYVLIIGESMTRDHMNAYGYSRDNTPFQTEAAATDRHYTFFDNAYSCYTQTVQVLTYALTEKNQYNNMNLADAFSIIDMARAAGFTTTWISNQSQYGIWDTPIGAIGSVCDNQYWINKNIGSVVATSDYDGALVPYLQKADPNNRRQLIVIHLMGSHVNYWDRYPKDYNRFNSPNGENTSTEEAMINSYDNSVAYNDDVIRSIMDTAVNDLHADGVLYFSDHGEQVTANPGHNADQFTFTMVRIPLWVYLSDSYQSSRPLQTAEIRAHKETPFTNDMIYDTFCGIMGMNMIHYDQSCDLSSAAYGKSVSDLLTMYGNVRISDDKNLPKLVRQ